MLKLYKLFSYIEWGHTAAGYNFRVNFCGRVADFQLLTTSWNIRKPSSKCVVDFWGRSYNPQVRPANLYLTFGVQLWGRTCDYELNFKKSDFFIKILWSTIKVNSRIQPDRSKRHSQPHFCVQSLWAATPTARRFNYVLGHMGNSYNLRVQSYNSGKIFSWQVQNP